MRYPALAAVIATLVPTPIAFAEENPGLAHRVAELETQVAELTAALEGAVELLQYVRVETGEIEGLTGPHVIAEGANVHVRSGSGSTEDGCTRDDPNCASLTGLGNLIVGYNEPPGTAIRTGSHTLVVGPEHRYSSFGGLVAGRENVLEGPYSSVSGGQLNLAVGPFSSVSGGQENVANGSCSWVGGGLSNNTQGSFSSVSGGVDNFAIGSRSSVSGGADNTAQGNDSSVSGGREGQVRFLLVFRERDATCDFAFGSWC